MNTKKIIAYIGVFAVLIVVVVILNMTNTGTPLPLHILSSSISSTSSTSVRTTSILYTTTRSNLHSFCVPSTPTASPLFNGNFSTGTYVGWNATGKAFGSTPLNLTYMNNNHNYYGSPWTGYNNTFVASTYQGFLSGQGNLTSKPFQVVEPYLNFKIISAQNQGLYLEAISGNTVFERVYFDTFNQSINGNYFTTYLNGSMNLYPLLCKNASIKIVSDLQASTSSKYSYISAGNFYLSPTPKLDRGIIINTTILNYS